MTPRLPIVFESDPTPETVEAIDRSLTAFNLSRIEAPDLTPFALVVRNEQGEIIAGLKATSFFDWLAIELLWVDESLRGQGYGSALLARAEAIGRERGCVLAFLTTLSFQAPDFYAEHGYTEFGTLENPRTGLKRHYFRKSLETRS